MIFLKIANKIIFGNIAQFMGIPMNTNMMLQLLATLYCKVIFLLLN